MKIHFNINTTDQKEPVDIDIHVSHQVTVSPETPERIVGALKNRGPIEEVLTDSLPANHPTPAKKA